MEKVYIPQREKHYTLEDWMIRFVINCSIKEWMEILGDDDWGAELSDMDLLLGRGRKSASNAFDSCLNQLSDENLSDILLLEAMGEDLDDGFFSSFANKHLVKDSEICYDGFRRRIPGSAKNSPAEGSTGIFRA